MIEFKFNDGGREAAGFKGQTGDCVTRAIAIVTGKPYIEVYNTLNELAKPFNEKHYKTVRGKSNARTGMHRRVYHKYLLSIGMKWTACSGIGIGCKVHLRKEELPAGIIIARLSKHLCAVIDGVINDLSDCSREGIRCVYGYYSF